MVSKASEDLPEPETPVTTVSELWGISKSMFLRLWTLAPRTTMVSVDILRPNATHGRFENVVRALSGAGKGSGILYYKAPPREPSCSRTVPSRHPERSALPPADRGIFAAIFPRAPTLFAPEEQRVRRFERTSV